MLILQDHRCKICGEPLKIARQTHVDHCHVTNKVRGILCGNCNTALGKFKDSPALLRKAAEYLEKNK